jgi:transcription elongation factor Elf1
MVRSAQVNKKTRSKPSMKKHSVKPEIAGTRSGYVIRFTCPLCNAENSIVNKTPRDHYKMTRDAACSRCRKRIVVTTPAMTQNPGYSPVSLPVKLPVTK